MMLSNAAPALFSQFLNLRKSESPFVQAVQSLLNYEDLARDFLQEYLEKLTKLEQNPTADPMSAYRPILALSLLMQESEHLDLLKNTSFTFSDKAIDRSVKLVCLARVFLTRLLDKDFERELPWEQFTKNFSVSLDLFHPRSTMTFPFYLAEEAILLCLNGQQNFDDQSKKRAEEIFSWLKVNTRTKKGELYRSVFTRETESQQVKWEAAYAVLSKLMGENTDVQVENVGLALEERENEDFLEYIAYLSVLERVIQIEDSQVEESVSREDSLSEKGQFHFDESRSLFLCDHSKYSAYICFSGRNTSLGSMTCGDAKILALGPQFLPLGVSSRFGIEGDAHSMNFSIEEDAFRLRGQARAYYSRDDEGKSSAVSYHSGVYLDLDVELQADALRFSVQTNSVSDEEEIAIAFYLSGERCSLANGLCIKAQSLDRYEGHPEELILQGTEQSLKISVNSAVDKMRVIPIAGDRDYWGANFLLAYSLPLNAGKRTWTVSPLSSGV